MENHFKTLGAHRAMTTQQLKTLYRDAARKVHPDVAPGHIETFTALALAYGALTNVSSRRQYDAQLALLPACPACSGSGTRRKQRGFTSVEVSACEPCAGSGRVL